jgi:transposase
VYKLLNLYSVFFSCIEGISEEKKGHGRRSLDDYRVSKIIHIPHDMLKPGEECPLCYLTGRKNSGENLDDVLDRRPKDQKRPVQVCDASTQNLAERHETDLAKCLNHARHNFCELVAVWPKETMKIIEMINTVFFNDRATKKMDEGERLKYHQLNSSTVMNELQGYCNELLDNKIVEPNSGFGKAIRYLNNHWEGLTLFLRDGKAPLSNNDAERAIKSLKMEAGCCVN